VNFSYVHTLTLLLLAYIYASILSASLSVSFLRCRSSSVFDLGSTLLELLETRRVRSDLIETFKIVDGKYSINSESFLNTTKVEEEDTQRSYLKRGPDMTYNVFGATLNPTLLLLCF